MTLRLQNFIFLAAILIEGLGAYPWFIWITDSSFQQWQQPPLSLIFAFIVLAVTGMTTYLTLKINMPLLLARFLTIMIGVLFLLLLVRLQNNGGYGIGDSRWLSFAAGHLGQLLGALFFGFYLVWRGIRAGREEIKADFLYRDFAVGTAGFVLLVILWNFVPGFTVGREFNTIGPYLLGFFFTMLFALGISNFQKLGERISGPNRLFLWRWVLILASLVVVILFIAVALAPAFTNLSINIPHFFDILAGWALIAFLYLVVYPIAFLTAGLYYAGHFFIGLVTGDHVVQPFQAPEISALPVTPKGEPVPLWPALTAGLKWGLFTIVIAAIIWLIAKAIFQRWQSPQEQGVAETNESLWNWQNLKDDLSRVWLYLTSKFRRKTGTARLETIPPVAVSADNADLMLDIRDIYRGLLWEGGKSGLPKGVADTPFEYSRRLQSVLPEEKDSLAAITRAYVANRYGNILSSPTQSIVLARLWLQVRNALRLRKI